MGLSIPHLLVVLAIVVLVFGTKRLKNVGGDLGEAIKGFRKAINDGSETTKPVDQAPSVEAEVSKSEQEKD